MLTRREILRTAAGAVAGTMVPPLAAAQTDEVPVIPDYERPLFDLPGQVSGPVTIESIELLRRGKLFFVRVRSTDGATGLVNTKNRSLLAHPDQPGPGAQLTFT